MKEWMIMEPGWKAFPWVAHVLSKGKGMCGTIAADWFWRWETRASSALRKDFIEQLLESRHCYVQRRQRWLRRCCFSRRVESKLLSATLMVLSTEEGSPNFPGLRAVLPEELTTISEESFELTQDSKGSVGHGIRLWRKEMFRKKRYRMKSENLNWLCIVLGTEPGL